MRACFDDDARITAALRFERELAAAHAEHGEVSAEAAAAIAAACDGFDRTGLIEAAAHAGTLAIPLVERLRAAVGEHAAAVHRGATSQDVADTALVLQLRAALSLLDGELDKVVGALADHARAHARTPALARTLLQPADAITHGVRFATWYRGIVDARDRVARELAGASRVQLGGAVGTLAALGANGPAVRAALARRLGLADAPSWHARRDALTGVGVAVAIVTAAIAKLAHDIVLLAAFGAMAEAHIPGRGGSSAMPHKRNPTGCVAALAAAAPASGLVASLVGGAAQELERGAGGWQAEGAMLCELFVGAYDAARAMRDALAGLEVHATPQAVDASDIEAAVRYVDELLR